MPTPSALHHLVGRLRIRHLTLLDQLGKDPHVGRCARRLSMSQPTASKLLREIEEIFGVPLFTRNRRGLIPTAAGLAMSGRASLLLAEMEATHAELLATLQGATGRLRLGIFPVAIPEFLPRFSNLIQEAWPGLLLSIQEGVEHQLLSALSKGELDCVLGRVVLENLTPDLRYEALYQEPTTFVCGVRNPIAHREVTTLPAALQDAAWVLPANEGAVYNLVASRLAALKLPAPRIQVETTSVFATIELLQSDDLVSVLPQKAAQWYSDMGKVRILPIPAVESSYAVGMIFRGDAGQSKLVQTALSACRLAVAANRSVSPSTD